MQSSGASWVTFCLAQRPAQVAVVDLHGGRNIDSSFRDLDSCVVKYTINRQVAVEDVANALHPDRIILVKRSTVDIARSLNMQPFRNFHGSVIQKLNLYFELCQRKDLFDEIIEYETFGGADIHRSVADVLWYNFYVSVWCRRYFRRAWGFGRLRDVPVTSEDMGGTKQGGGVG